jgi:hypothetical protein
MALEQSRRIVVGTGVLVCVVLLSLIAVFNQVKTMGLGWQEAHYVPQLEAVATGTASGPGQYRVLSDVATLGVCRLFERVGVPRGTGVALVLIRVVQNVVIYLLALWYFRKFGVPVYLGILGVSALAWGMTQANYQSDLAINTYTDIIFYLCAGLLLQYGKVYLIVAVMVAAALNRETCGLIPVMVLAVWWVRSNEEESGRYWKAGVGALVVYGVVFVALRLCLGGGVGVGDAEQGARGLALLQYNLAFDRTWLHLFWTLGIVPVLAMVSWRYWPRKLKAFCWAIVPLWFVVHFCMGQMATTRLVLVPQVMIFIPGLLCGIVAWREAEEASLPHADGLAQDSANQELGQDDRI